MEDLFGGECNMFNPAATEENDEDQPAGNQTLLQRAHGGTSCMCCSGGPLATSLLANSTDVSAAASGSTPDDEQPGNEEGVSHGGKSNFNRYTAHMMSAIVC